MTIQQRPSKVMATVEPFGDGRHKVRDAGGVPAAPPDFMYADCASTANQALTGTPTLDGVATSGKKVLLKNQSTASQNGLYNVSSAGVWSKVGQPKVVAVLGGTTQGKTHFMLTAANTYSGGCAYFG